MKLQPEIIKLLNKRGIKTEEEISEFLSDKPQKTYDPFLLLNMEAGVDLVLSAIENEEKICIYGDYDTDGITSTSLLLDVLSHLTDKLSYHLPSRFKEGYGLNCNALKEIRESGVSLVITVDCGSVSPVEVDYAKSIGLKMLVTDHHTIGDTISDCLVINPKQPGCPYPFKELAGVGVAFKLAQAIAATTGLPKTIVSRTLDLVGIGTIGDIVPLVDENRTLAKYGLRTVRLTERPGLDELIKGIGLDKKKINSGHVSFGIVPHLNAAGRLDDASYGVELMTCRSREEAEPIVEKLIALNSRRKNLQEETFKICMEKYRQYYSQDNFILVELEEAHEGITGIVAGKLKERYYKPAVIVTPVEDGLYKGTGRSIDGINLYNLLNENAELFEKFGGHKAACGFTIRKENINRLRDSLNASADKLREENPELYIETVTPDLEPAPEDITFDLLKDIDRLEPFGCENPKPFVGITARAEDVRKMGKEGQYIRFSGILSGSRPLSCVVFKSADKFEKTIYSGKLMKVTGDLGKQEWNGRTYLQLNVKDIK